MGPGIPPHMAMEMQEPLGSDRTNGLALKMEVVAQQIVELIGQSFAADTG